MRLYAILGGAIALVIAGVWLLTGSNYTAKLVLPAATNIIEGGRVQLNGFDVGRVEQIELEGQQPLLTLSIDRDHAPLHEGAQVVIEYQALLGERLVQITDGPASNPEIPSGGLLAGSFPKPTEVDDVLAALDPPTLKRVSSLVNELNSTVKGHENDINLSVEAAGPALKAVGGVLDAIGTDGPAVRALVTRLNDLTGTLAARQGDVRTVVTELARLSALAKDRRQQLREALTLLPPTLRTAQGTLDRVPPVVDEAVPLLQDLEPGTARLPSVARNLRPVLEDLRPTLRELGPTLSDLDELLDRTPELLDAAEDTVPGITDTLDTLEDPVNFLRPYTPEAMGWISQWNSSSSNFDANGHFMRFIVHAGTGSVIPNPGVQPPLLRLNPYPDPGSNGGTPWTDAFGSGVR